MLTDEQKELLIWGGGALVVMIILAVVASSYGGQVIELNREIRDLHGTYSKQYQEAADRLPVEAARSRIIEARDDQQAGLAAIEGDVLATVDADGDVVGAIRATPNASPSFTYNEVVDRVNAIVQRL